MDKGWAWTGLLMLTAGSLAVSGNTSSKQDKTDELSLVGSCPYSFYGRWAWRLVGQEGS